MIKSVQWQTIMGLLLVLCVGCTGPPKKPPVFTLEQKAICQTRGEATTECNLSQSIHREGEPVGSGSTSVTITPGMP